VKSTRHHRRPSVACRLSAGLALCALVIGGFPTAVSYRCLAMDTVNSQPCCDEILERDGSATSELLPACCERIDGAVSTVQAVREPAPVHTARLLAMIPVLSPDAALSDSEAGVCRPAAFWFRAGSPDPRCRIPTVVLRV
jgi:hypothetical protein